MIHVPRYRTIELAFRRFFALRELAVTEPDKVPPSLKPFIEKNKDFHRKPAKPFKPYRWADPLGFNWIPPDVDAYVPFPNEGSSKAPEKKEPEKPKSPPPKRKGREDKPLGVSAKLTLAVVGVAGLATYAIARRKELADWVRRRTRKLKARTA